MKQWHSLVGVAILIANVILAYALCEFLNGAGPRQCVMSFRAIDGCHHDHNLDTKLTVILAWISVQLGCLHCITIFAPPTQLGIKSYWTRCIMWAVALAQVELNAYNIFTVTRWNEASLTFYKVQNVVPTNVSAT